MLTIFVAGIISGIIPCYIYGKLGGDPRVGRRSKRIMRFLHYFHHWMVGLLFLGISQLLAVPLNYYVLGWGLGMTLDDMFFHSFENSFNQKYRRIEEHE